MELKDSFKRTSTGSKFGMSDYSKDKQKSQGENAVLETRRRAGGLWRDD